MASHNSIIKIKKIKDYIISINEIDELIVLTVKKNNKILKSKSYVLSRESSLNKEIKKLVLKQFNLIKQIIYCNIEITEDDYDFLLLERMN